VSVMFETITVPCRGVSWGLVAEQSINVSEQNDVSSAFLLTKMPLDR